MSTPLWIFLVVAGGSFISGYIAGFIAGKGWARRPVSTKEKT